MIGWKHLPYATIVATLLFFGTNSANVPVDGDAGPAPVPETGENQAPTAAKPESPPAGPVNATQPKLNDYQESSQKIAINNSPESRVTITVGEENGFKYTVYGHTYSHERIAVSGEYFNDEYNAYGYCRLFLVAEPSIGYYAVRPVGNRLDVYVQNYYYEEFYYEIHTPYPVQGYDLRHGQVNGTAILITGPSRSAVHGRSAKQSSLVTTGAP